MMVQDKVERKLTVILHADAVGYSQLTGRDEEGTHRALIATLDAISDLIRGHDGNVINFAGDAVLAEFASAVKAVECAVNIQHDLNSRNEILPQERKLQFRIGVNLGDIIVAREDIYGDGVNVAARLESLAKPGGICISGTVFDQVKNKLELGFEHLGKQRVKNIAEPVRAYRVILDPAAAGTVVGEIAIPWLSWRSMPLVTAVVVILVGSGFTVGYRYLTQLKTEPNIALVKDEQKKSLAKPSIAVLPFKNLSGDAKQGYFSDGITQDIITDLSKFNGLFVIASSTAFTYKGKAVNVQAVGRELGVRYVLEGSVQRAAQKVRVNAQLIDSTTGRSLWADRYVRELSDIFTLQDEIVRTIVSTLAVKVDTAERRRAVRKGTKNMEVYDSVLRGRELCSRTKSVANDEARKFINQAIERDPDYAPAYVALGWCYMDMLLYGWTATPSRTISRVHDLAQRAIDLDNQSASAHRLLGTVYYKWQKFDLAAVEFDRAHTLNPNDADTFGRLGAIRLYEGKSAAAIDAVETALRFNPNLGVSDLIHLGLAYYLVDRSEDAITTFERARARNPDLLAPHVGLAAAYAQANRSEDAVRAAADVRRLYPFFKVETFGNGFRREADRVKIRTGLLQAGLS